MKGERNRERVSSLPPSFRAAKLGHSTDQLKAYNDQKADSMRKEDLIRAGSRPAKRNQMTNSNENSRFNESNTEGYSAAQLNELNRLWELNHGGLTEEDDGFKEAGEALLSKFDEMTWASA